MRGKRKAGHILVGFPGSIARELVEADLHHRPCNSCPMSLCSTIAYTNRRVDLFTLFLALDIFVESVEVLHSGVMLPSQSS